MSLHAEMAEDNAVLTVTLRREDKLNALNIEMLGVLSVPPGSWPTAPIHTFA